MEDWDDFVKTLRMRVELGTEPLPKRKPVEALGTFALPPGSVDAPSDEVRRLLTPPTRSGDNLVWAEVGDDGEARSMIWIPNGEADRVEMERFFETASAADRDER